MQGLFFFFLSGGYGSVSVCWGGTILGFHDNHVSTHRLLDTIHFLCLNFQANQKSVCTFNNFWDNASLIEVF